MLDRSFPGWGPGLYSKKSKSRLNTFEQDLERGLKNDDVKQEAPPIDRKARKSALQRRGRPTERRHSFDTYDRSSHSKAIPTRQRSYSQDCSVATEKHQRSSRTESYLEMVKALEIDFPQLKLLRNIDQLYLHPGSAIDENSTAGKHTPLGYLGDTLAIPMRVGVLDLSSGSTFNGSRQFSILDRGHFRYHSMGKDEHLTDLEEFPRLSREPDGPFDSNAPSTKDIDGSKLWRCLRESSGSATRIIVTEGLTQTLVNVIGEHLELDPEAFSEVLAMNSYQVNSWNTASLKKPFCTLRWCVPWQLTSAGWAFLADNQFGLIRGALPHEFRHYYSNWSDKSYKYSLKVSYSWFIRALHAFAVPQPQTSHAARNEQITMCFVKKSAARPCNTILLMCDNPVGYAYEYNRSEHKYNLWNKFENLFYRGSLAKNDTPLELNPYAGTLEKSHHKRATSQKESTAATLWTALNSNLRMARSYKSVESYATSCVLQVVQRDCLTLVRQVEEQLVRLRHGLADDDLITGHLKYIQWALNQQKQLLRLSGQSLNSALNIWRTLAACTPDSKPFFFRRLHDEPDIGQQDQDDTTRSIYQLRNTIRAAESQILDLFSTLVSTVTILDSNRQIQESSSVTKLTELAFFFIPLGFSATLYGMQIKEFDNKVNLTTFIATAIVAVSGSYILRLLLRSRPITWSKSSLTHSVRGRASIPEGTSIPASAFFIWLWNKAFTRRLMLLILVAAPSLSAGLITIWKYSSLSHSARIAWTVNVVPFLVTAFLVISVIDRWRTLGLGDKGRSPWEATKLIWDRVDTGIYIMNRVEKTFLYLRGPGACLTILPIWMASNMPNDAKIAWTIFVAACVVGSYCFTFNRHSRY